MLIHIENINGVTSYLIMIAWFWLVFSRL